MTLTFEEARDQIAKEAGYKDWSDLNLESLVSIHFNINPFIEKAAELHAESRAKDAWERACEDQKQFCADQFLNVIDAKVRQTAAKEYCLNAPKPPYKP